MHHFLVPLLAFTAAAIIFVITPGLDTLMVLRTTASDGRHAGIGAICGVIIGLTIWGIAAVFGLTALLAASERGFFIVKCIGALYLAWMGIGLLLHPRAVLTTSEENDISTQGVHRNSFWLGFRRGVFTNLFNPKVGIFIITFFPQFIPPHVSVVVFTLLQVIIHAVISCIWLGVLVVLTAPLARFLNRPAIVRRLDRVTGLIFIVFGAKIFLTRGLSH